MREHYLPCGSSCIYRYDHQAKYCHCKLIIDTTFRNLKSCFMGIQKMKCVGNYVVKINVSKFLFGISDEYDVCN